MTVTNPTMAKRSSEDDVIAEDYECKIDGAERRKGNGGDLFQLSLIRSLALLSHQTFNCSKNFNDYQAVVSSKCDLIFIVDSSMKS